MPNTHKTPIPESHYQPYDGSDMARPRRHTANDEFGMAAMELAGHVTDDIPEYEHSLMIEELIQQILEPFKLDPSDPLQPLFVDVDGIRQQLSAALDPDEQFLVEQNLPSQNALAGMTEQLNVSDEHEPQSEMTDHDDQVDAIFTQEAMFDDALLAEVGLEQDLVHETAEGADPSPAPGPDSLEQIIEAEGMNAMAEGTIEEPLDEAAEPMEEAEPYRGPHPYGDPMMAEEMCDEMMMYGADPFMMGGYGPMLGPGPGGPP
jgi:hypothetical protein